MQNLPLSPPPPGPGQSRPHLPGRPSSVASAPLLSGLHTAVSSLLNLAHTRHLPPSLGTEAEVLPWPQALHDLPPSPPCLPSLTLLQPHGPPRCSSNTPGPVLPQGLCTGRACCLESPWPRCLLPFFGPLLKSQVCSKSRIQSWPLPKPPTRDIAQMSLSHTIQQKLHEQVLGAGLFCCPHCPDCRSSAGGKGLGCSTCHGQQRGPLASPSLTAVLASASPFTFFPLY